MLPRLKTFTRISNGFLIECTLISALSLTLFFISSFDLMHIHIINCIFYCFQLPMTGFEWVSHQHNFCIGEFCLVIISRTPEKTHFFTWVIRSQSHVSFRYLQVCRNLHKTVSVDKWIMFFIFVIRSNLQFCLIITQYR